ncbi:hypothetical protein [Rouxiella sp. Mn2063]|uniref:hypothetical protein n=1 Tax=Rouxiella sp. Mn2063 TaxID=3395262 RepID=UPI003BC1B5BA
MVSKACCLVIVLFLSFSSIVKASDYKKLNQYTTLDSAVNVFNDKNITSDLKTLLDASYSEFINNFEVFADPQKQSNGGLFIEGWLQDLRLENASAMVIEPDGKLYVAWVIPGHSKIEYRTNDQQMKGVNPDLLAWSKRFEHITFDEKRYPIGFIDNEPKVRHLDTKSFNVKVTLNCDSTDKPCNHALYEGTRKSDGATLTLHGKVFRARCSEPICSINSYEFKNKNATYTLETIVPSLTVIINHKMVVDEKGVWSDN